jgi:hypothetical protein
MRNTTIKFEVEGIGTINVSSTMKGKSKGTKQFNLPHYMYNLKIWSEHGKMNATFHDSAWNYARNVKKLNEEALRGALDCILSDISMYLNDEIRGCYDEDEEVSLFKQVETACRNEYEKFILVVGGDENVWTAIQSLSEQINGI